jgi:hypothetical protein
MRLQYDWSSNGIFNAAHVGLRLDSNGAAPEFDLVGSNSLGSNSCAANVANGSKPEVAALRLDVCFAPVSGRRV